MLLSSVWLMCVVSNVMASLRINSVDESSAEELIQIEEPRRTFGPHNVWSNIGQIIRDEHPIQPNNERAALSCQLATVEVVKAGTSLASIVLMMHLKTNFDKLCSNDLNMILFILVTLFGIGMVETLVSIIGVCTNCADRVTAPENYLVDQTTSRRRLRQGLDIVGGLGILLGFVKTAGIGHYLTNNVDTPICGNTSPNNLFELDIVQVIMFTSIFQMIGIIASIGLAFIHDRHS